VNSTSYCDPYLQVLLARLDTYRSFHGVQYTAISFGKRLEEVGIVPSMGRTGTALDNAMAESFLATLKTELLVHRRRFLIERWREVPSASTWKGFTTDAGYIRRWATRAL
jgi:transposase InsO family protein